MSKNLVLIFALTVVACTSGPWWRPVLDEWVGARGQEVFQVWGAPVEQFRHDNGNMVYVYESTGEHDRKSVESYELSRGTDYMRGDSAPMPAFDCRTIFEMSDDIVVEVDAKGSGCDPKPLPHKSES